MKTKFLTWLLISVAFASRAQQQMWLNPHPPGGTNSPVYTNVTAGGLSWWTLDDTSGTDAWPNNDTMIFVASPSSSSGKITNCISFNGVSQYGTVSPIANLDPGTGSWTLCLWAKTTSAAGGFPNIAGAYAGGSGNAGWAILQYQTTGQVYCEVNDGTTIVNVVGASTFLDGNWHFFAMTIDRTGNQLTMYQDGASVGNASISGLGSITSTAPFTIATRAVTSFFGGSVDNAQVYNRAITSAEVTQNYQWGLAQ